MVEQGYTCFDIDSRVSVWAKAARRMVDRLDTSERRHGRTWFVGVDALQNAIDGSVEGVPLAGPWPLTRQDWHAAQVSIVYPGYPGQDAGESDAAHRYRINRDAAHMDGLLPEGPARRRHLREPHAFVLGIPLNDVAEAPLVVWPGSHRIMGAAFAAALYGRSPITWGEVDVTEVYQAARRRVFDTCKRVEVPMVCGQSILLHRHLIHGVAPWADPDVTTPRIIAYFRPQFSDPKDWL